MKGNAVDNRATVQTIYDAADIGDLGAIERVLADDVVLYEPLHHPAVLADDRPTPGVWRGRDEVLRGVGGVFAALRLTGVELETLVVDGDRLVGILDVSCFRSRPRVAEVQRRHLPRLQSQENSARRPAIA